MSVAFDSRLAMLVSGLSLVACTHQQGPSFVVPPTVEANPNEFAPLAAIAHVTADRPVSTRLTIDDGERSWELNFDANEAEQTLPVLELRPGRRHEVRVAIRDQRGRETLHPEALEFTTPAIELGTDLFPPLELRIADVDRMEPGVTVLSMRRTVAGKPGKSKAYGLMLGINEQAEVVWYMRVQCRENDVEWLANGHILYISSDSHIFEVDLLGNVHASWYAARRPEGPTAEDDPAVAVDALIFHHDVDVLPSGNLIVMSGELETIEDYPKIGMEPSEEVEAAKVIGDRVIEIDREGNIVWEWNSFDELDPHRVGYDLYATYWPDRGFPDTLDWTHGNGLDYWPEEDLLLISLRMQDAVFAVERESGEVRWLFGEDSDWSERLQPTVLALEDTSRWFYHQHFPIFTPEGNVMVFDNGLFLARPQQQPIGIEDSFARAVEYAIDPARMTAREVWASDVAGPDAPICPTMGGVDLMPTTQNALVSYGMCRSRTGGATWSQVREFDRETGDLVWEVVASDESDDPTGWTIYGAERGQLSMR